MMLKKIVFCFIASFSSLFVISQIGYAQDLTPDTLREARAAIEDDDVARIPYAIEILYRSKVRDDLRLILKCVGHHDTTVRTTVAKIIPFLKVAPEDFSIVKPACRSPFIPPRSMCIYVASNILSQETTETLVQSLWDESFANGDAAAFALSSRVIPQPLRDSLIEDFVTFSPSKQVLVLKALRGSMDSPTVSKLWSIDATKLNVLIQSRLYRLLKEFTKNEPHEERKDPLIDFQ